MVWRTPLDFSLLFVSLIVREIHVPEFNLVRQQKRAFHLEKWNNDIFEMKPFYLMEWMEVDCSPAARRGPRGRSRGSRPWSGAGAPPPSPSTEATLQWWGSTYRAYFNPSVQQFELRCILHNNFILVQNRHKRQTDETALINQQTSAWGHPFFRSKIFHFFFTFTQ